MTKPTVHYIFVAPAAGALMQRRTSVLAIKGRGLEGDRYSMQKGSWKAKGEAFHKPKRNMTIASVWAFALINDRRSTEVRFQMEDTRRNLFVDMDVNVLIGRRFRAGSVLCQGVEYSVPCNRPSVLSRKPGFEMAFLGNGGVNCEILENGEIFQGDPITLVES